MSTPVDFDLDGLYIILSDLDGNNRFHWGLYLETSFKSGEIFHLTALDISNDWIYETRTTPQHARIRQTPCRNQSRRD